MPNFDVSSLLDGTLTVIATATDAAGNTATVEFTVEKDTTTQVAVSDVTDPIGLANQDSVSINGTGEAGDSISVVASDGVNSTIAFAVTVNVSGEWSIDNIDVSALDDGTITFTVTAEDALGNTMQVQATADKDTSAEPLTLVADANAEGSEGVFGEDEDWLSFD